MVYDYGKPFSDFCLEQLNLKVATKLRQWLSFAPKTYLYAEKYNRSNVAYSSKSQISYA